METDLVFKVLSGSATELELQQVEAWKNSHVKNAAEFDALQMYWNRNNVPGENEEESGFDQGIRELKEKINKITRRQRIRKVIMWIAIAVISGFGAIYLSDYMIQQSYRRSQLKFDSVKITEVIGILEQEYNVTIELPVQLKDCVLSASIYNATLQSSLNTISRTMGWKITATDKVKYRIEGEGCGLKNDNKPE